MPNEEQMRRQAALDATSAAAASVGLNAAGVRVIEDWNNTVVLLPAENLVSKVSTSTLPGRGWEALQRELQLGHHLAQQLAPIAPPAPPDVAGPHLRNGTMLTFWCYRRGQPAPQDAGPKLGQALRGVHGALEAMVGTLPTLADKVNRAAELFRDTNATRGLGSADRHLASRAHSRLRELLSGLDSSTGLHGEPHEGNIIWTDDGPLLIDFEGTCAGPLEWDLAYLPDAALTEFPGHDPESVARLGAAVSYCVAAWCWAQPTRAPRIADAAEYHLAAVKRSWLAA